MKERENLTEISGTVIRIRCTFDNGFRVLDVEIGNGVVCKVVGTPLGSAEAIQPQSHITAIGEWTVHPKWGEQFTADALYLSAPHDIEGLRKYFSSGLIPGIGPTTADMLISAFGADLVEVLDSRPERLLEVRGIGPKRYELIVNGWEENKAVRHIMQFLTRHNVSTAKAVRIYKTYGSKAVAIVSENPYLLARDVNGIGFKSADKIARDLGIDPLSPHRLASGLHYTLEELSATHGHTCQPYQTLVDECAVLLELAPDPRHGDAQACGISPEDQKAARERIVEVLDNEIAHKNFILANLPQPNSVYLPAAYYAERYIANTLAERAACDPPWRLNDPDKAIRESEKRLNFELSPSQKRAVMSALQSRVLVITGGPGVGKTTVVRLILDVLKHQCVGIRSYEPGENFGVTAPCTVMQRVNVRLCAPTGRAAKRLAESSGMEASTIHRMLKFGPEGFKITDENPLDDDLFIVDECSMVDVYLASALLKGISKGSAIIFVGDVDQLPSVGAGNVLRNMIESNCIPVVRLTEIHRQAESSLIVRVAHDINNGRYPTFPKAGEFKHGVTDCVLLTVEQDRIQDAIVELVSKRLPFYGYDPVREVQVLTPMRTRVAGVNALNTLLQQALNPLPEGETVRHYNTSLGVGDKVMQIENDYGRGVFNGDVGYITEINREDGNLTVDFGDVSATYELNDLDGLVLSYACTIHKSQGSEYKCVVIPVTKAHSFLLKRNLLYTAVTRGKKFVVLVGEKGAVYNAVQNFSTQPRMTGLEQMLREAADRNGGFELT